MRTAAPSDPAAASAGDRGPGAEADGKILGAPRIAERFAGLTKDLPGLSGGQVEVRAAGPFAGGRVVPADKKPGPQ